MVIGPPPDRPEMDGGEIDALLLAALKRTSLRDAVREVTDISGLPRQTIYHRALAVNNKADGD